MTDVSDQRPSKRARMDSIVGTFKEWETLLTGKVGAALSLLADTSLV